MGKSGQHFRMLLDVKGRFTLVKVDNKEATFKLCKVQQKKLGKNKIPYIVTHDGRTIRYPHPDIKVNDSIKLNLETGEVDGSSSTRTVPPSSFKEETISEESA